MESWVSLFLAGKLGQMAFRDPFQRKGFCVSMPSVTWWFLQSLGRAGGGHTAPLPCCRVLEVEDPTLPSSPTGDCWKMECFTLEPSNAELFFIENAGKGFHEGCKTARRLKADKSANYLLIIKAFQ